MYGVVMMMECDDIQLSMVLSCYKSIASHVVFMVYTKQSRFSVEYSNKRNDDICTFTKQIKAFPQHIQLSSTK